MSRRLCRLLDHRRAGAAVVDRATGAGGLDHRAWVRRRRRADGASGLTPALNDRALPRRGDRGVLGRDAACVDGAAAERGAFLAENLAVGRATRATGHCAATGTTGHRATGCGARGAVADAGRQGAAAAGVAAQAGATCDGWGRRLGRHVAAQRAAVAAHDSAAALATDAQSGAARGTGATLTADADAAQWTGNVRSRSAVQRGALTGNQSRLTGRAADERGVTASAGEATDVAGTSQPPARGKTGLARQTASAGHATTGAKAALARQTGLAGETGLPAKPAAGRATKAATGLATRARAERTARTKTTLASEAGLAA